MNFQREIREAVRKEIPRLQYNDSLRVAIKEMAARNTSAVVVEKSGELIGIVSEMDIVHTIANGGDIDEILVAGAMTACDLVTNKGSESPCVQLDEDETVASALAIMNEAGVHHLLVSGVGDEATGLVAARDLLELATL